MHKSWLMVFFLMLPMCAHIEKKKESSVNIGSDAFLNLKEPKDILPEIQLVQVLSFQYKDKSNSSQGILSSKDNKLTIVALLPFGGEAFRVEYANGEITSKALPGVESGFELKYALGDIIITYADGKALQTWLSPGAKVIDTPTSRVITYKDEQLVRISYDKKDRFSAMIKYEHLLRGYKINIQPVSQGKP